MPDFSGIPLQHGHSTAGSLFLLRTPSRGSAVATLTSDVQVEIREGVKALVVRGLNADSHEDVMAHAPELANQALDIFSVQGVAHLALDDLWATHVIWWHEARGLVVRFWCAATSTLTLRADVQALTATGEPVAASPPATPRWEESMRYYRVSELTEDLFDAFRNVCLALESLLSAVEPVQRATSGAGFEREESWFKRALASAAVGLSLGDFVTNASGNPVHDIYDDLQNQVRHRVFHAKDGRGAFLPHADPPRIEVADAHARYRRLYLALAESHFGETWRSGGTTFSNAASQQMRAAMLKDARIGVTTDSVPTRQDEPLLSPGGQQSRLLTAVEFADPRGNDYTAVIASASVADVTSNVPAVGRLATVNADGEVGLYESLEGRFPLEGFNRLEVVFSVRVAGQQARKVEYLL